MFAGRSLGKAFRPSHFAAESEPEAAENPVERQSRIHAYAQRVRMKLPLFETEASARTATVRSGRCKALTARDGRDGLGWRGRCWAAHTPPGRAKAGL